jgi:tetratricopeptide (TPR) repeat protein
MHDESQFGRNSDASSGARAGTGRAARSASAACALAAAMAFGAAAHAHGLTAAAQPQQGKPQIADEVEKAKKGDAGRESAPKAEAPPKAQPSGRRPSRPAHRPSGPSPLEVTFKTDLPNAEIFLNRGGGSIQSLGRTDSDGNLTVRLQRGRHSITASRPGARILRQQIEVDPDSTNFTFNLALPQPPPQKDEVAEAAPAEPTPTPEETTPTVSAEEVVRRFLDAKESEGLTAEDWKQAEAQARTALEQSPEDKQLQAQSFLAEGQLAYLRGDYATALVSFNKSAIANPDYVPAHYGLGNAYLATNQPTESLASYRRASELDKTLALPLKGMGDALTKLGRTREATTLYGRAKSFGQPLPTNTGLLAARDLKKRKRWKEALKEFEEVVKTEQTAEVYIDIGDCYVGLEQSFSASKAYQKATELDPKNALAHFKHGEIMFREREYAAALEAYERALALDTTGQQFNRKTARERANEAAKKLGLKRDQ